MNHRCRQALWSPHTTCLAQTLVSAHRRSFHRSSACAADTIAKLLLAARADQHDAVTVHGFVRSVRKQKKLTFAMVGDGSTVEPLQVVLSPVQAKGLATGAGVRIRGHWQPSPEGKEQMIELHAKDVDILGSMESSSYPLQKKFHTAEYLRTVPHLRSRTPFNSLLLRLRSHTIAQCTTFFAARDFVQTHPPVITSSDCEGAGQVFTVGAAAAPRAEPALENEGRLHETDFFRSPKYLTVSSQLHLEALAQSVGRVWTLAPTFRAERSDTQRHLSEFYMLEAEVGFADSLDAVMSLTEDLIRTLARGISESRLGQELLLAKRTGQAGADEQGSETSRLLEDRWQGLMQHPWPRMSYTEAVGRLQIAVERAEASFKVPPDWTLGLQSEHEQFLVKAVGKGRPVFVTDYPRCIKPFYMLPSDSATSTSDTPTYETVSCFDLLLPGSGEVAGGSMREHRLVELLTSMRRHRLLPPVSDDGLSAVPSDDQLGALKWYVDLRRWGSIPHGGFGLGFDRLLGYLAGVPNIREVVTFPRWVGRCDC